MHIFCNHNLCTRMESERPRTASVSRSKPPPLKRLISVEEQDKLKDWEAIKRREAEAEEEAMRALEREALEERRRKEKEEEGR